MLSFYVKLITILSSSISIASYGIPIVHVGRYLINMTYLPTFDVPLKSLILYIHVPSSVQELKS